MCDINANDNHYHNTVNDNHYQKKGIYEKNNNICGLNCLLF